MARINGLVIKPGDHLRQIHSITLSQLRQYLPKGVFHPHTGDHAVNTQGVGAANPKLRIGVNKELAHNGLPENGDRKSTRLNSSHVRISYAVFCLKKKKKNKR